MFEYDEVEQYHNLFSDMSAIFVDEFDRLNGETTIEQELAQEAWGSKSNISRIKDGYKIRLGDDID